MYYDLSQSTSVDPLALRPRLSEIQRTPPGLRLRASLLAPYPTPQTLQRPMLALLPYAAEAY